MGVRAGLPDEQLSTSQHSKFNQSIAIWIAFDSGKDFSEEKASAMRLLEALGLGLLLMVCFAFTAPVPEPQNGRQTAGLVTLNTMTLMPLLLAGAAFAKGYLIGNLKHRKVSSGHGGYGPPLGYNRLGYGYPSYHQDPYPHRRVDDTVAEQAAVGGDGVETLQQQYQRFDQHQHYQEAPTSPGANVDYYQLPGHLYGGTYFHV